MFQFSLIYIIGENIQQTEYLNKIIIDSFTFKYLNSKLKVRKY